MCDIKNIENLIDLFTICFKFDFGSLQENGWRKIKRLRVGGKIPTARLNY